jgi:Phospholipase A2-like domain
MFQSFRGGGWITKALSKIPAELHIPGYNFCGPNTKLEERLALGQRGINPLDEACREHDILYSQTESKERIAEADKLLANRAWTRFKDSSTPAGEKIAAMLVTGAMKAKIKTGGAIKKKKISDFDSMVKETRKAVKKSGVKDLKKASRVALAAANKVVKTLKKIPKAGRVLPIPKRGGILPFLIPIFAGISAAGGLAGGAAAIAKAVNDAKSAKKSLEEMKRHNSRIEAIAIGKTDKNGSGYYLKPYKNGYGIVAKQGKGYYLKPQNTSGHEIVNSDSKN